MTLAHVKEASLNKVKLINWRVEMLRIFRVCEKKKGTCGFLELYLGVES